MLHCCQLCKQTEAGCRVFSTLRSPSVTATEEVAGKKLKPQPDKRSHSNSCVTGWFWMLWNAGRSHTDAWLGIRRKLSARPIVGQTYL